MSDWSPVGGPSALLRAAPRAEKGDQPRIALGERAVAFGAKLRVDDRCRGIEESDGAFILAGACHRLRILHPHRGAVLVRSARRLLGQFEGTADHRHRIVRSEEHTSELQSLMRISYAVFCLKKKPITLEDNRSNSHRSTHTPRAERLH